MSKQLSISERMVIERMLHQDYTFASIARKLERSPFSISREIKNYRCFVNPLPKPGELDCVDKYSCLKNRLCLSSPTSHLCYGYRCKRCPEGILCSSICKTYISSHCILLDRPPYVCSGCTTEKQKNVRKIMLTTLLIVLRPLTKYAQHTLQNSVSAKKLSITTLTTMFLMYAILIFLLSKWIL